MLSRVSRRRAMVTLAGSQLELRAIAVALQCSVWTVRRWILRSRTTGNLDDLSRSGTPAVYSEEARLRMVAFYCQTRPLPNCGRWSLRWAARHLEVFPERIGVSPSKSTLHRVLKSNRLKPHQSRYFLHITDPDFFPKMEHLVGLFKSPPRHLFFFDECPGIQVLQRLTPDLQTDTMKKRLEEFEYIRHGTLDVFAFLNHSDGKVVLECQPDHATATFLAVFRRHVKRFRGVEPLHYVMDNLSTHLGYPFCQLVAEFSGIACPPEHELNRQTNRMEWLRRQDKRIVIHFTPYHGSWLNLIEIWFGILSTKVLSESFAAPEQLKNAIEAFADDWNLLLAHPFRWQYDGQGLHEKAVRRFTKMLSNSTLQMDLRILTKLLTLMTNLLNNYFLEVSEESWYQLATSFSSQSEHISTLIDGEGGPQRRANAQRAMANLITALHQRSSTIRDLAA